MLLFIISLIILIISSVLIIRIMKNNKIKEETPDINKREFFKLLPYNSGIIFALISLLFFIIFSMFSNEVYRSAFILMALTVALEYLTACFYIARPKKLLEFISKTILILSVLELTIFNFPAYHLLFGDYEKKTLKFSECEIEVGTAEINQDKNEVYIKGRDEVVLTFKDLDTAIGTIYADIEFNDDTNSIKTVIDITDETSSNYRYNIIQTDILKKRGMSNYMPCDFSGKTNNFRIKFTGYNDESDITVKSVVLNKPIPFEISYIRIIIILILLIIIYSVCCVEAFREPFSSRKRLCRILFAATAWVCCILAAIIVYMNIGGNIKREFHLKNGNQITQELVDAFESGQVNLKKNPSESILNIENPYDRNLRESNGASALWDHVLYDGKYYSYYGVAPVLLLYLPYHLITGYYCSTSLSILLFSIIGMIFLSMTYYIFIKKYFSEISSGIAFAGHIVLMAACGIWYSIGRNIFYEISIASGFMFVAMGAYFLFSSNVVGGGKISLPKTFLASLFLAFAVLCRPTLAVYCICACVYFAYGFFKKENIVLEGSEAASKPVKKAAFLICAAVPFVILGGFQMWYNYARFGSPLDFGIQYSLTVNDFTHAQYHTIFVFISLFNYLFAAPSIFPNYPFISTSFNNLKVNGFYFNDEGATSGIIFLAFPVLAYIFSGKALKRLPDRKSKIKSLLLVGLPCVIMPLIIIFSIWESGYAVRYVADFSWQMILGAYAILFMLYTKSKNETKKDLLQKFMTVSAVCALIINGVQIFIFTFDSYFCSVSGKLYYPEICWSFEHIINFWK